MFTISSTKFDVRWALHLPSVLANTPICTLNLGSKPRGLQFESIRPTTVLDLEFPSRSLRTIDLAALSRSPC